MKIGVLTSSRADYGIYLPLLQKLKKDAYFDLVIIAFGTHTSKFHGYTLEEIQKGGYETIHSLTTVLANDDETAVSTSFGLTALKFADFWSAHANKFDLVFCLGDRYEMAAAVEAGIPGGVRFAHLHGGETTLGAIDNIYRHQISLASELHFTATDQYAERVKELTALDEGVYVVGSLSLDGIEQIDLPEVNQLRREFELPTEEYALLTFHPETLLPGQNEQLATAMYEGLRDLTKKIKLVITMPNADTYGSIYRKKLKALKALHPKQVCLVENFGKANYFSVMKNCRFLLGNSSSGIIEAASFGKFAVNVGNRQKGRVCSPNVLNCAFSCHAILNTSLTALEMGEYSGVNLYYREGAADKIIQKLKRL
jgi:GDP/UDP-N,N'-diacetylbacillosamine 2-epimerase (hydrolysing)